MSTASLPWAGLKLPVAHHRAFAENHSWADKTLADLAYTQVETDPGFISFVAGPASASRAQILGDAEALATGLADLGLRPGDVVSFQVPNWIEAAVINLACTLGGFVINPIVPIYRDAEVGMMLEDCKAKVFIVAAQFRNYDFAAMAERLRPALPDLTHVVLVRGDGASRGNTLTYDSVLAAGRGKSFTRAKVDPGAVKMILYTSGTTGRPKGVLHSHSTLLRVKEQSTRHWGIQDGDAIIMPSPVTHVSGYANGLELPFVGGTKTVLMESWNAEDALALIERYQVTGTVAATPFLTELANAALRAGKTLPSLRFFACGGAAVAPDIIPAANRAFAACKAFRVFGSSEVPLVSLGYPGDEHLAATTDGAVIDYDVRIVDDAERPLPRGQSGEILARGPAMFMGYADAAQTAQAITADGYFRTGDIGFLSPDGAITITGRKKDLIIRGGENISAKEIEDVLHGHPDVKEAAVVAMPHARLGEGICAYVILKPGATAESKALAAHVQTSGLARQKIPEHFEFVGDFPRTASGKIKKDVLRADIKAKLA